MTELHAADETLIFDPGDDGPDPDENAWQALAMLEAMVNVWTARGRVGALDKYLAARRWTTRDRLGRNPLGNLNPFADFHRVVTDAAVAVRWPYVPRSRQNYASARHE
jgi:hypothetical protein